MKATSNPKRATASAALRRAREEKEKELQQDAASRAQLASAESGTSIGPARTSRRRSVSQASDSSDDIPIASMPGATPPKRKPGRPRKAVSPDSAIAAQISPKRALPASSEETTEPATIRPAATTTAKTAKKATVKVVESEASPKKCAKKPAAASTTAMPDYAAWERPALQAETGKYGYKPSASKAVLVGQLTRIWVALHPGQATEPQACASSTTAAKRTSTKAAQSDPEGSESAATAASPKKKVGRPRKAASADEGAAKSKTVRKKAAKAKVAEDEVDIESDPEDLRTAGERLREAILADEAFYLRLLRYEVSYTLGFWPCGS